MWHNADYHIHVDLYTKAFVISLLSSIPLGRHAGPFVGVQAHLNLIVCWVLSLFILLYLLLFNML